jgi:CheY-like chemotaxis protein
MAKKKPKVPAVSLKGAESAIVLRAAGHDVRVAHDGPSAVKIATAFQPEVIFLDVGMPGQDGYETATELREKPQLEGVLLVAVTGYGRETDRERAREAGFDEFLIKPTPPDVLCAVALRDRPSD